jgi:outer membrane protein, heavy metal efflux system
VSPLPLRERWLLILIPVVSGLALSACASYRAAPLGAVSDVMTLPVADVLSQQSRTIDRPFLTPVAVDLAAPLDLNAIAVVTVLENPDLKAQRERAGIADAQAFSARLLPDPVIGAGIDHILSGPDPLASLIGQVGLDLAALRSRKAVTQGATAAAQAVRLDLAWAEWQVAGSARLQAVRVVSLERAGILTAQSKANADDLLARSLRASGRGDIRADEVESRRLAAIDAGSQARAGDRDLDAARLELLRLMGLSPQTRLKLADQSLPQPSLDAQRLAALAEMQRLDLKALQAGYAAQEAAVHKAVLDQFPNLTLNINGTRDNTGNKLLGPSANFTLPLWNRNRGGIAVATATRAALKAEYEARLFQTRASIAAAVSGIEIARSQRGELAAGMPALARFATATRRAANHGDLALATAQTAEQSLRDKQLVVVQLDQAIAEQLIALELLVGVPIADWPNGQTK